MDFRKLKDAIAEQDIVYVNLAGNLESMTSNIVKAMHETGVKRIIAVSSIGSKLTQKPLTNIRYSIDFLCLSILNTIVSR